MRQDSPNSVKNLRLSAWAVGLAVSCAVSSAVAEDLFAAQPVIKTGQSSAVGAPSRLAATSAPPAADARTAAVTGTSVAQTTQRIAAEGVAPDAVASDDPSADQATLPKVIPGWDLIFSPYTVHYSSSDDHKPVVLLGLVKGLEGRWLAGAAAFSNSFGQPSVYAYVGQRYLDPFGWEKWYLQWSAGIVYGYVDEFEDKVPLNYKGFSPGVVPSVGYRFSKHVYGELDFLGAAGLMFSVVFPLPRGTP